MGLLVTTLLVALGGGSFWAWWSRPIADEATVERVGRWATDAIVEARRMECPRSVLRGEPIAGDATAELVALLSAGGRFGDCARLVEQRTEDLAAALEWTDGDLAASPPDAATAPVGSAGAPVAPATGWELAGFGGPVRSAPSPVETEILAACAGLDDAVTRIVSHASVCTPLALGEEHADMPIGLRLEKALAVLARERIRRGQIRAGFELLLDGVRLGADVQRGRPDLTGAMIGGAMADVAIAHVHGLSASELAWLPGDLEELERQALVLARTHPPPAQWMANDAITTVRFALERRGWIPPYLPQRPLGPALPMDGDGDRVDLMIAHAAFAQPHLEHLCEGTSTREDCVTAIDAELRRAGTDALGREVELGMSVPRLSLDGMNRGLYALTVAAFPPYVVQALGDEARVRALAVLFVHRRLALGGVCPRAADLEAAIASLPIADGFGGRFEIHPSDLERHPLEVCAPTWLWPSATAPAELPLLDLYCPVLGARAPADPTTGSTPPTVE